MQYILSKIYNKFIYRQYLRRNLGNVGKNFRLGYNSELINPKFFFIESNFFTGPYCYFVTNKNNIVEIGNYVMFGPKCNIIGGNHDYRFQGFMYENTDIDHQKSTIKIEDGVWIGAGSTILSRSEIGEGSIIGAMSIVNKYIPPFVISAGNPARIIKSRFSSLNDLENTLKNTNSKYKLAEVIEIHKTYNISY